MIDTPSPTDKAFGVTKRGFTGHKHLDGTGLIHMNGRAYDPISGRFLSVDPFIQSPENSQSFNPYSYVMNNPLSGVDPSGYVSSKVPVTASVVDTTNGVHIGFIAGIAGVTEEEAKKIFELCENGCNVTKEDGKLVIQASNGHSKETTYYASRVPGSTASGLGGSTNVDPLASGNATEFNGTETASTTPTSSATLSQVKTVDDAISIVQTENPTSMIRVTGRARTTHRQAELMADRIIADEAEFLSTYVPRAHIKEMVNWVHSNPKASRAQTVAAFDKIINKALVNGAKVSNHLSNTARDISIPRGGAKVRNQIENRFNQLGVSVIREPKAAGGPHWHLDF